MIYQDTPPPAPIEPPLRMGVDVIGVVADPAPLPEGWTFGDTLNAPIPRPGWHVNVKNRHMALFPELAAHVVEPSGTPLRSFATGSTVRLWFESAEAAEAVAPDLQLHLTDAARAELNRPPPLPDFAGGVAPSAED